MNTIRRFEAFFASLAPLCKTRDLLTYLLESLPSTPYAPVNSSTFLYLTPIENLVKMDALNIQ